MACEDALSKTLPLQVVHVAVCGQRPHLWHRVLACARAHMCKISVHQQIVDKHEQLATMCHLAVLLCAHSFAQPILQNLHVETLSHSGNILLHLGMKCRGTLVAKVLATLKPYFKLLNCMTQLSDFESFNCRRAAVHTFALLARPGPRFLQPQIDFFFEFTRPYSLEP